MARIDKDACIGCGICQGTCPEGFTIVNGKAHIKNSNAPCIQDAAKACPVGAISTD